jgi:DNA-binding PadR family transcriptional regulator
MHQEPLRIIMSIETTAYKILLNMKRFMQLDGVIWTRKMISESIRENINDVIKALTFLERKGYISSIKTDYKNNICTEYHITTEGHQAVEDAITNPSADRGSSAWIYRARSGFSSTGRQSRLERVAIPKGSIREEQESIEEQLDAMRDEEAWARDFE